MGRLQRLLSLHPLLLEPLDLCHLILSSHRILELNQALRLEQIRGPAVFDLNSSNSGEFLAIFATKVAEITVGKSHQKWKTSRRRLPLSTYRDLA